MKDWQFYPLLLIAIVALVAFAYTRGHDDTGLAGPDFIVEGETLNTFYAAQGVSFSIAGDAANPNAYAVLSAHVSRKQAPPSAGVFLTLPRVYKQRYAGKPINVTVTARKGRASKLESFDIAYLSTDAGSSGWQTFNLSNDFETYSFPFTPRQPSGADGTDFVGIWPDVEGEGQTLDVKRIELAIIESEAP